uniref:Uncharacterized protein n=1 Tax=Arundo donax TaxID=35708 RepID=A0A0A9DJB7_ARUDO
MPKVQTIQHMNCTILNCTPAKSCKSKLHTRMQHVHLIVFAHNTTYKQIKNHTPRPIKQHTRQHEQSNERISEKIIITV